MPSTATALSPADAAAVKVVHSIADAKMAPDTDLPFWVDIETQIIGHMQNQQAGQTATGEQDPMSGGDMGMGAMGGAMGGGQPGPPGLGQAMASGLPSGPVPGFPSGAAPSPPAPPPSRSPLGNPSTGGAVDELRRVLSQR